MENEKIESPFVDKRALAQLEVDRALRNKDALKHFEDSLDSTTLLMDYKRLWAEQMMNKALTFIDESDQAEEDKVKLRAQARVQYDKSCQELESHVGFVVFIRDNLEN
jgi:hypothetical protein